MKKKIFFIVVSRVENDDEIWKLLLDGQVTQGTGQYYNFLFIFNATQPNNIMLCFHSLCTFVFTKLRISVAEAIALIIIREYLTYFTFYVFSVRSVCVDTKKEYKEGLGDIFSNFLTFLILIQIAIGIFEVNSQKKIS